VQYHPHQDETNIAEKAKKEIAVATTKPGKAEAGEKGVTGEESSSSRSSKQVNSAAPAPALATTPPQAQSGPQPAKAKTQSLGHHPPLSQGEERQLKRLIELVKKQSLLSRKVLVELLHQEEMGSSKNKGLSVTQLKTRTGYKLSNLMHNKPYELLSAELITKEGDGPTTVYYSNLQGYIQANLVGVDPQIIRERLLASLP